MSSGNYGNTITGQGEDDKAGLGYQDPPNYTEDIEDDPQGTQPSGTGDDVPAYNDPGANAGGFVPAQTEEGKKVTP
ncbi:hypothetical protein PG993_015183 [Apiospora rasikravindrae]|uniref:Uncharacterized protein n=1 Tax=Apiospora rasikravindrae TaxID=990691 RepID=A0ABR1RPU6_9PEZI